MASTHLAACATAPATPVSHSYFEELGEVEGRLLARTVDDVLLADYEFAVERRDEQYASVYFETGWKERDPFFDEEAVGVTAARSRVVIRGLRVSDGDYRVTLEGENQIRTDSVPGWHTAPLTVDFREWMEEIEGDLRQHAGLR